MPVTVKVYAALAVFEVAMLRVETKLGVPLLVVKVPVAPAGSPVIVNVTDGKPIVDEDGTSVTETA